LTPLTWYPTNCTMCAYGCHGKDKSQMSIEKPKPSKK